ncbi:MAG TPA: DUF748 domain-containing protein, partial [Geobacteraceae bacterium]|nr:DUF748 domain-containing protein [Geobacteraceae bacterium]
MTVKTYLKVAAGLLLAAAFIAAAGVIIVPRLLNLDTYRPQILSMAQKALHRPVSFETASFSWRVVPSFDFRGITIAEKSGKNTFLHADRLTFKLAILPLFRKEVRLKEIVVERPVVMLDRNRAGVFNIDDLLAGKPSEFSIHLRSFRIINGLVRFTDRLVDPEGFTTSLENLDLHVGNLARGKNTTFRITTTIADRSGNSAVSVSGTARIPAQGEPPGDAQFDVALSAKSLHAERYWPYYGHYLPCKKIAGVLDLDGRFKGKPNAFTAKGHLGIRALRFDYPRVFHSVLTPREVCLA